MFRNYYRSAFFRPILGRAVPFITNLLIVLLFLALPGCGGKGKSANSPANVGGGFTLVVSGGTLNNGSGSKGVVVLATLRDEAANGPGGAAGWKITITGPGINAPLVVNYDDGSPSSYMTWWWKHIEPLTGKYTATASNGSVTLVSSFTIDIDSSLPTTTLSEAGDGTISWPSVTGAGSYYYQITDSYNIVADCGYLSSGQTSFVPPVLPDGDFQVVVIAHTRNRFDLMSDPSSAPALPAHENMSSSTLSLPISGSGSGYYLTASGGVLYMGKDTTLDPAGVDQYGLAVWTSIQTSTGGTPPAGDWTVTVTGPGIGSTLSFTYPATYSHYQYWDFGFVPGSGLYTVSATNGSIVLTRSFTIQNTTAQLPLATGLSASSVPGGYSISWAAAQGASSYYVNLWTCVGAGSVNTLGAEGCTGTYTEIAGGWVNTTSAFINTSSLTSGLVYDVYVTASALDMTTTDTTPPPSPGTQVDMSDTTFTYATFTAL